MKSKEVEQAERREVIKNEFIARREPEATTYFQQAQANEDLEAQGRFASAKPTFGGPEYPRQQSGPWSEPDPVPAEGPLGFSVEEMEPVGTLAEQEEAQRILDSHRLDEPGDEGLAQAQRAWERRVLASAVPVHSAGEATGTANPTTSSVDRFPVANSLNRRA